MTWDAILLAGTTGYLAFRLYQEKSLRREVEEALMDQLAAAGRLAEALRKEGKSI